MCGFVWSVYMISASNCQTPYKKLTRIVKGSHDDKKGKQLRLETVAFKEWHPVAFEMDSVRKFVDVV